MKRNYLVLSIFCSLSSSLFAQEKSGAEKTTIFLPGKVSSGYNERDMAISPDGSEMFYTIQALRSGVSVIIHRQLKDNWSEATVASFSGQYSDLEPAFSPDGKRLFFASNRPVQPGTEKKDFDIWFMEKSGTTWGSPVHAGPEINTAEDEWYPSITKDGSVYFTAVRPDALGKEDIYRSQWSNNKFQTPVNIGQGVNSKLDEFNAFIDPDEKFLLFSAEGGEGDLGRGDLYISYKNSDGTWTKAKNLGASINSSKLDYCPFVHKGVFYFTSDRPANNTGPSKQMTFQEIRQKLDSWGNGWGDVYTLSATKVLEIK